MDRHNWRYNPILQLRPTEADYDLVYSTFPQLLRGCPTTDGSMPVVQAQWCLMSFYHCWQNISEWHTSRTLGESRQTNCMTHITWLKPTGFLAYLWNHLTVIAYARTVTDIMNLFKGRRWVQVNCNMSGIAKHLQQWNLQNDAWKHKGNTLSLFEICCCQNSSP